MSNLLAMPQVRLDIETGNNEDWIDSIKFMVDTGEPVLPQLDIRNITFEMEIRRAVADHEVVLTASTENNTLRIGAPPDVGFLLFYIPLAQMRNQRAGTYVGDITGRDGIFTRTIAQINLTIIEGVTKQPVHVVNA
jgi:hypothetical protein